MLDAYFRNKAAAQLREAKAEECRNRRTQQMENMTRGVKERMNRHDAQYWLMQSTVIWGGLLWRINCMHIGCGVYEAWATKDVEKGGGE